jgi:hypothetical protein
MRRLLFMIGCLFGCLCFGGIASPAASAAIAPPANLVVTGATETSVTVSWNPVSSAAGYDLSLDWSATGRQTTATSATFSGLNCSDWYNLGVAAHDGGGNTSATTWIIGYTAACGSTPPPSCDPFWTYCEPDGSTAKKITICHATGSSTNPYVQITISENAIPAHLAHQDGRDIIPAPKEGCPQSTEQPPPCDTYWQDCGGTGQKVTICHATGSATNPYVQITISENALPAHLAHQDGRDIIPAPANG